MIFKGFVVDGMGKDLYNSKVCETEVLRNASSIKGREKVREKEHPSKSVLKSH